jgi:ribosomal protein S18 acetylase RimI-like enzyme
MAAFSIRAVGEADRAWIGPYLSRHRSSPAIATRGRLLRADELPGFVAEAVGVAVGLLTMRVEGDACEVVTLNSEREGEGIGTALLAAAIAKAREASLGRLFLVTTNDNLHAIRFYRRRGLALRAVYARSIEALRLLKPEIAQTGFHGIPIRDGIEFELVLRPA